MHIQLTKPELQEFIREQVETGRFASATEVVEAGLAQLRLGLESGGLDEETLKAIEASESRVARGDSREWKEVSAELRRKYLGQ
jgi:putative addiction module CopG family antidote